MAKAPLNVDVLVLGDHPSAYFAAAILQRANVSVAHARIPGEVLKERLVTVNPELFELDPFLRPMKRRLTLYPTYGLRFLADNTTNNGCIRKTIGAYVASLKQIQSEMSQIARRAGVSTLPSSRLEIESVDEKGLHLRINNSSVHAKLLLLAGELRVDQQRMLGLPAWPSEAICRYTFIQIRGSSACDLGKRPAIPMSLNIQDTHHWAWLLPWRGQIQLAVEQPHQTIESLSPATLLKHWATVLVGHSVLKLDPERLDLQRAQGMDLPLAGALIGEGVANRTLCVGPAGGFYTACAEDVYPNCWSALCAVEVAKAALKERHLQDALQAYRQRWGATLGDYLRGPQQNLRFLLPLVYRNSTMASRLTDAILLGKSVVR